MNHDVVIVNVPKTEGNYLPAAPAVLKGCCKYLGVSSVTIDLNLDFLELCGQENINYQERLVGITEDCIPDSELQVIANQLIKNWADNIMQHRPKIVAISLFSYYSQYFGKQLAKEIKSLNNDCTIVIGGSGIKISLNSPPLFAQNLVDHKHINSYIENDGEIEWYNFLVDFFNLNPGEFNTSSLNLPWIPDYSDYTISRYQTFLKDSKSQLSVPVTGSRGCVRQCDFCEIHQHWKFAQRSSSHIIEEIKAILNFVDNPHFHFTDSLVNGNLKEFDLLIDALITLKQSQKFSWGGQFIIRDQYQFNEDRWRRLAESGARNLEIGVETGSETLRYKMNKPFTNQDLDFSMSMMDKYQITCVFLLFIGHPAESDLDFDHTISMMEKYQTYQNVIIEVQLGYAMAVQQGTPLYDQRKELGIVLGKNPTIWMCTNNMELTYGKRLQRRILASNTLKELGYTMSLSDPGSIAEMEYNIGHYQQEIKLVEMAAKKMSANFDFSVKQ